MNKEILLIIDTVSNEKNVDREIIINAMATNLNYCQLAKVLDNLNSG